ncbi:nuclear protein Es2-domain-containing protein [Syncephalis plumigaleata]|nr:nuclear protein Es2-domain-containing protein [Syncephalis plumigaleata]
MNSTPKLTNTVVATTTATASSQSNRNEGQSNSKAAVLEEDEYTEAVSKIVERDYFPTLSAMKQYERHLNVELAGLQGASIPNEILKQNPQTPAIGQPTPLIVDPSISAVAAAPSASLASSENHINTDMSLDAFQARYTTEDNDSYPSLTLTSTFSGLMEKAKLEHREKYAWIYKAPGSKVSQPLLEAGESKEQKLIAATPYEEKERSLVLRTQYEEHVHKPAAIRYEVKNSLMFQPEGYPLFGSHLLQNDRGAPKQVCSQNTRLPDQIELALGIAASQNDNNDSLEIRSHSSTPLVGNYRLVAATPTLDPTETGSTPMMTWGTIEGTPALLSSTPGETGHQTPRTYHIPPTPKRDIIGRRLSERASKQSGRTRREDRRRLSAMSPAAAHLKYVVMIIYHLNTNNSNNNNCIEIMYYHV